MTARFNFQSSIAFKSKAWFGTENTFSLGEVQREEKAYWLAKSFSVFQLSTKAAFTFSQFASVGSAA